MTAHMNTTGAIGSPGDVPGLQGALDDLHAATDAVAVSLAAFRPPPFTRGFTYAPDASLTMDDGGGGPADLLCGAGFHALSDARLRRWSSAFTLTGYVVYQTANLNDYGWYSQPIVVFPNAWLPGTLPSISDLNSLPPLAGCKGTVVQRSGVDGHTVQTDTNVDLYVGSGGDSGIGLCVANEVLDSSLFVAGDHLLWSMRPGEFLVLPDNASFA